MRNLTIPLLLALVVPSARADFATATFEDQNLGADSTAIDFRPQNSFTSGGFTFNNDFTPPSPPFQGFYEGFGLSTKVDNVLVDSPLTSSDFDHRFGAYAPANPGTGSGGSATYAVVFNDFPGAAVVNLPSGFAPFSIDVANTTYAASSIRYGDQFSNPFGPGDYFKLDILGFSGANGTGTQVGDVPFTLASDTATIDAPAGVLSLVSQFTTVPLVALAGAQSLEFNLTSNVTNQFGPTVPLTFAVDNLVATRLVPVPEPAGLVLLATGALGLGLASRGRTGRDVSILSRPGIMVSRSGPQRPIDGAAATPTARRCFR